ncbi:MAG: hypothetical protein ACO3P1_15090 [Pseudomonadales bacterium]
MSRPESDSADHLLADLDGIRSLLDDETEIARGSDPSVNEPAVTDGGTMTEALVRNGLADALQARTDAILEHFINETLQVELAMLRARLQEAIRTEIDAFISTEIRQTDRHGTSHGE